MLRKLALLICAVAMSGVGVVAAPTAVSADPGVQNVVTLVPARFLDTRPDGQTFDNAGQRAGVRPAFGETQVQITGRNNIPSGATAAIINIAAVRPSGTGFVTAYPCGTTRPNASTLNHTNRVNIANGATIRIGSGGRICLYNDQPTNLVVDVTGYVVGSSEIATLVPARFLDTRPDGRTFDRISQAQGVRPGGSETRVQITGRNGIPSDAQAAIVNIAVVRPSGTGFVTAYPCGLSRPDASTLNHSNRVNIANGATIALSGSGEICLFNDQPTNIVVDVTGYVVGGSTEVDTAVPARFLDTRDNGSTFDGLQQGDGRRDAFAETQIQITGRNGIPTNAVAAVINIAAVRPTGTGFVTAYPCGTTRPNASTLNHSNLVNIANGATIAIGTGGKICLYNDQPTNLVVDVTAHINREGTAPGGGNGEGEPGGNNLPPLTQDDVVREAANAGAGRYCLPGDVEVECRVFNGSNATIAGTANETDIGAGRDFSCVSLADGTVSCYGSNDFGQLGNGTNTSAPASAPAKVLGISTAVDVDAGFTKFACATLADGTVQCWGRNDSGQLGNGSTVSTNQPITVPNVTNAVAVSAGSTSACALISDRTVKCWGTGLLGNGTKSVRAQPVDVVGLNNAVSISVGGSQACAVTTAGQVLCWGENGSGQLGNGTRTAGSLTVVVNGVNDAVGASAGVAHSCVRRSNASVSCWGEDGQGQTSGRPGEDKLTPVTPVDFNGQAVTGVTAVATGDTFSVFITRPI